MILKIKQNIFFEQGGKEFFETIWIYCDDIAEIRTVSGVYRSEGLFPLAYCQVDGESVNVPEEHERNNAEVPYNGIYLSQCENVKCEIQSPSDFHIYVIIAYITFRSGEQETLAFQHAYLLNDEGKTIERL